MHPFLRSPGHVLLMGLFWSPIALCVIILQRSLSGSSFSDAAVLVGPLMLIELFICLSVWFPCKAISLEQNRLPIVLLRHALSAAVLVSAWLLVGLFYSRVLSDITNDDPGWAGMYGGAVPLFLTTGLFLYFTFSLIYYMVLALDRGREADQEALENRLTAGAAELTALKASIHPHFLFNSLTSLSALTRTSPELAQKMCLQLADFLRYSLNYGNREWVRVEDELEHIEDYLGIEKIRLGDRLNVEVSAGLDTREDPLPPFTLLPLVENAVKHGFQTRLEPGTLTVTIEKLQNALVIEVVNPFEMDADIKRVEGGHGLRGLQKRLANAYAGEAEFRTSRTEGAYRATLRLPLNKNPGDGRG